MSRIINKITPEEEAEAFDHWLMKYAQYNEKEDLLVPFLNKNLTPYKQNQLSWLKFLREGLCLTSESVAKKLKMTRAGYSKFEENEKAGAITLASLAKAAAAMDCELVYAIRPKNKKHFLNIMWEKLLPTAKQHSWLNNCVQHRRGPAISSIAKDYMNNIKFRAAQGWSKRALR